MVGDPRTEFLQHHKPAVRDAAERLIATITGCARFDEAIKWRQLTFAIDSDFDHWVCAVSATATHARVAFHFGTWLDDPDAVFDTSDAEFVRRISYRSADEVDQAVVRRLVTQALEELPRFRARRRDPAPPSRRRS
ncbi:DUF1801 domain-containing protein [Mycobacterium deserti]|uniref:DUF1801 domain-containing protein n=1 Tax=Mycobacterium deserti TaxID=2978347 RepID=A0ABT2M9R6_9MYCO|nr:DUF1801 domain-containing protein [Mycobacterium deserti]MCT7658997.1 DUF1801 domain-containing protein [Mycobacterium deserti]